jgi:hypothetical protein
MELGLLQPTYYTNLLKHSFHGFHTAILANNKLHTKFIKFFSFEASQRFVFVSEDSHWGGGGGAVMFWSAHR